MRKILILMLLVFPCLLILGQDNTDISGQYVLASSYGDELILFKCEIKSVKNKWIMSVNYVSALNFNCSSDSDIKIALNDKDEVKFVIYMDTLTKEGDLVSPSICDEENEAEIVDTFTGNWSSAGYFNGVVERSEKDSEKTKGKWQFLKLK